jgi:hypothetical protein
LSTSVGPLVSPTCAASKFVTGGYCTNTDSNWVLSTENATAVSAGAWQCDFANLTGTSGAGTVTVCVICTP